MNHEAGFLKNDDATALPPIEVLLRTLVRIIKSFGTEALYGGLLLRR